MNKKAHGARRMKIYWMKKWFHSLGPSIKRKHTYINIQPVISGYNLHFIKSRKKLMVYFFTDTQTQLKTKGLGIVQGDKHYHVNHKDPLNVLLQDLLPIIPIYMPILTRKTMKPYRYCVASINFSIFLTIPLSEILQKSCQQQHFFLDFNIKAS